MKKHEEDNIVCTCKDCVKTRKEVYDNMPIAVEPLGSRWRKWKPKEKESQ